MRTLKIAFIGVGVLFLLQGCGGSSSSGGAATNSDQASAKPITLASLQLRNLDGSEIDVSSFAGKRVFVNFWATWCKPCLAEMPSIDRAATMLAGENVVMLAASDEKPERIRKFSEKNPYSFTIIATESDLALLEIFALPATFIFDGQGKLVYRETGARDWASPESIKLIKETQK